MRGIKLEGNRVRIPDELEFETDKATFDDTKDPNKTILGSLKEFLEQNRQVTKLRIEGHTDNAGTKEHNNKLSQDRAQAVSAWLIAHGVDKVRVVTVGHGDRYPEVTNDTTEHKARNRRTEFHVQELDGKVVSTSRDAAPTTPPVVPAASAVPAGSAAPPVAPPPVTTPSKK